MEKDAADEELKKALDEILAAIQAYESSASSSTTAGGDQGQGDVVDTDYKPAE